MSLLLLGIRINEAATEMGPKNGGSKFRVEMWCSLWALAAPQKHTFDAGADDSAVQPLLSTLVEPGVPPDSVPNAYPRSSPSRCLRLSLSLNRRRTLRNGKISHPFIIIRLSWRDTNRSASRRASGIQVVQRQCSLSSYRVLNRPSQWNLARAAVRSSQ